MVYAVRRSVVRLPERRMRVRGDATMKRYKLDPKKQRQLTAAEAKRLAAAKIDCSDIPELDDAFFAKAERPGKQ